MSKITYLLPAIIAAGTMLVCTTATFGKAEYTKKEKAACGVCHATAKPKDGKDLNEVGKCYEKSKELATCKKK
jgi:hypothetical protein